MIRGIPALSIVSLMLIIGATVDAQTQPMPNSFAGSSSKSIVLPEKDAVKILGIDSIAFPKIKVNMFIDKFCAMAGNLKKENFKVKENGIETTIDNLYFTGNASGQKLDLAIVFDDTGSMVGEISAMKSKVKDLTDTIKASRIDANYSLVSFKDSVSVKTKWTRDPDVFKKQINSLQSSGGDDEPEFSLDAIESILSMGFRQDAQKVILVITDAHAHYRNDSSKVFSKYTKDEVEKNLKDSGAIFIPVSPHFNKPSTYMDLRAVANDTHSMWIDMNSADFLEILEQFKGMLTGTYVVDYKSPDQAAFGKRNVTMVVDKPACISGYDSNFYNRSGSAAISNVRPVINSLLPNLISPQDIGKAVNWTANASDADGDRLLYKFFLNNNSMTDWIYVNTWTWTPSVADAGSNQVEAQIRDGKHAGPSGFDDRRSSKFEINDNRGSANFERTSPFLTSRYLTEKTANTFGGKGDDHGSAVQPTVDGGYVIVGYTTSYGSGRTDVWLIKTDSHRNEIWNKTFGESKWDKGFSVQQTNDGGYIIIAEKNYPDINVSWNASDMSISPIWLIKTDSNGNKLWDRTFGEPLDFSGYSIQQTKDGGYIFVGSKYSLISSSRDIWLVKTDSSGKKLWDKTFGGLYSSNEGICVQQTSDGGYIVAGSTGSTKNLSVDGYPDKIVWLIKTDARGTEQWNKTFGLGTGSSVQQTSDGGYILEDYLPVHVNQSISTPIPSKLIKTDANGNKLWEANAGSGMSVQQTSDGGYITTGIIKTDAYGHKLWATESLSVTSIQQIAEGGYIAIVDDLVDNDTSSSSNSHDLSAGNRNIRLIKIDSNGTSWS